MKSLAARLLAIGMAIGMTISMAVVVAAPPAFAAGGGGCYVYENGQYVETTCTSGGGSPGSPGGPGSGGGGSTLASNCQTQPASPAQVKGLGLPPAPPGEKWELLSCPMVGFPTFAGVILVNTATGVPAVTPQQLLQIALGDMYIPVIAPATAPPRGKDGLVGLPEWFWVPRARWAPVSVTVTAGPVFATVTATPQQLAFSPGAGLTTVSCRGPGTAYNPRLQASAQHTACDYTYQQPSAGQPGNAYQASVTVTWAVTWTGSGGTGGTVNAGLQIPDAFAVRVAQAEALFTGNG